MNITRTTYIACIFSLATGCSDTDLYQGSFRGPTVAAVALASDTSIFSEPVGFVANSKGGNISVLALESGRFLTTNPAASFVRGNPIATGQKRILSSVQAWNTEEHIHVFAGDQGFNVLLEIPYIQSNEG